MYKKYLLLIVFSLFVTLVGCNNHSYRDKDTQLFSSQSEAIQHFIETEHIFGGIQLIKTHNGEQLLVSEYRDDIYFLGELIYEDDLYSTAALTANVSFRGSELGGTMPFTTSLSNKYTLDVSREKEAYSVALPDKKYYASVLEGDTIADPTINKSIITSFETVKIKD